MQIIKQTFKKEERLKSRKMIESLFETGKSINSFPFKLIYKYSDWQDVDYPAKIAITVSKKNFKRAVDRNNIKRKIREAYRFNKHTLYENITKNDQKIFFIVIYIAKENLDYKLIEQNLKLLINKLDKNIKGKTLQKPLNIIKKS